MLPFIVASEWAKRRRRMAGRIEAARVQRNNCDRDNFRMCVIRSHLGHLDRLAPASLPALMMATYGCLHFTPLHFTSMFERVPIFCIFVEDV